MHTSIIKHTNRVSISGQRVTLSFSNILHQIRSITQSCPTLCIPCFIDFSLNPVSHWSLSPPFTSFTTAENFLNAVRFHLSTTLSLLSSLIHKSVNRHSVSDHKMSLPNPGIEPGSLALQADSLLTELLQYDCFLFLMPL